ncbi:hypothetical protein SCHPADRAFT_942616 [Schizopora paradoxa]|uniref:BTB domain-containing protein n=1 Tax=Schizopora paradoxa TaxID=27342 RepID=A0A0H2S152_9AGAM|nr:hypothetical protein SCHPADRAFT_942616 [Schizopora paradoxa]
MSDASDLSPTISDLCLGDVVRSVKADVPKKPEVTERDELFYFQESDFISIQVEDRLFKIQKVLLSTYSTYFENLIGGIKYGHSKRGTTDEEPLYLDGTTKNDFRCYLVVLHSVYRNAHQDTESTTPLPGSYVVHDSPSPGGVVQFKLAEWRAVYRLAKMWGDDLTAKKAESGIEDSASSLEKLEIGLEHNVRRWASDGLRDLVKRETPLSQSEAPWMDAKTFHALALAREHRYKALVLRLVTGEVERSCENCGVDFIGHVFVGTARDRVSPDIAWTLSCVEGCGMVQSIEDKFNKTDDDFGQWRIKEDDIDRILNTFFPSIYIGEESESD